LNGKSAVVAKNTSKHGTSCSSANGAYRVGYRILDITIPPDMGLNHLDQASIGAGA